MFSGSSIRAAAGRATTLEWRWVKKVSGYLPGTIGDGVDGGDPDIFVAP